MPLDEPGDVDAHVLVDQFGELVRREADRVGKLGRGQAFVAVQTFYFQLLAQLGQLGVDLDAGQLTTTGFEREPGGLSRFAQLIPDDLNQGRKALVEQVAARKQRSDCAAIGQWKPRMLQRDTQEHQQRCGQPGEHDQGHGHGLCPRQAGRLSQLPQALQDHQRIDGAGSEGSPIEDLFNVQQPLRSGHLQRRQSGDQAQRREVQGKRLPAHGHAQKALHAEEEQGRDAVERQFVQQQEGQGRPAQYRQQEVQLDQSERQNAAGQQTRPAFLAPPER